MNTPQIHIPASNSPLKSSDEYLWHFTNQENLWNILCGPNGLLAGHAIFMKDTEDCSLLRRLNAIEVDLGCKLVSAFFPNTDMAESRKYLKESVKSGAYRNVFIACLTTTTREPKMWQEYTNNGGFAIGFDKERLESELISLAKKDKRHLYDNCDYSKFRQLANELDDLEAKCAEIVNHCVNKDQAMGIGLLFAKIRENPKNVIFSKIPELCWENEKRLAYVFEQGEVPKDRLRFIGAKPFVTVELSAPIATYVRCIRISPYGDVQKSRAIANLVASRIGLSMDYVVDEKMD